MRFFTTVLTLISLHASITAQNLVEVLLSSPSPGQTALANVGFIIPLKFGAQKSAIDKIFGTGRQSEEYQGRFSVTYENKNKDKYQWDFMEIDYVRTNESSRVEAYAFYFDKFDYQDKILSFFRRGPSMMYSQCNLSIESVEVKTGKKVNYEIKCMDYFEYDHQGSVTLHKLLYDYPHEEGKRFGKISISYRM